MTDAKFEHACCNFKSHYGSAILHAYSFGVHEEDNILCVEVPRTDSSNQRHPLVRVQSACYTAEIFRATDCDCREQLDESLELVHAEGGCVVYMICDGRGAGLLSKVRGLALGDSSGLDTWDAYRSLGIAADPRDYSQVTQVLQDLGLTAVRLLTNNPRKIEGLEQAGITVERVPLIIEATADSLSYLVTKQNKFGHLYDYSTFSAE